MQPPIQQEQFSTIRQKISAIPAAIMTACLLIGRPVIGLISAGGIGFGNSIRNGAGVVLGLLGEGLFAILNMLAVLPAAAVVVGKAGIGALATVAAVMKEGYVAIRAGVKNTIKYPAAAIAEISGLVWQVIGVISGGFAELLNIINSKVLGSMAAVILEIAYLNWHALNFVTAIGLETLRGLWQGLGYVAGATTEFLNIIRKGLGIAVAAISEVISVLKRGMIYFGAAITELLNIGRKAIGIVISAIIEAGNFIRVGISYPIAIVAEGLSIIRKGLGIVAGLIAEFGRLMLNGLGYVVAATVELGNILRKGIGNVVGAVVELGNLIRVGIGYCIAGVAEGLNILRKGLGLFCAGVIELGNIARTGIGFAVSLVAEVLNALRAGSGIIIGISGELVYYGAVATKAVAGAIAEGFAGFRKCAGFVLAGTFASIATLIAGLHGFKDRFNKYNKAIGGSEKYRFGVTFKSVLGEPKLGTGFKAVTTSEIFNTVNYNLGETFKAVNTSIVFGEKYKLFQAAKFVINSLVFGGSYRLGATFNPVKAELCNYKFGDAFDYVYDNGFGGSYKQGSAFNLVRASFGTYKFAEIFNKVSDSKFFGGKYKLGNSYENVRTAFGDYKPKAAFNYVYNQGFGGNYHAGAAFNYVLDSFNSYKSGKTFTDTRNFWLFGGEYNFGTAFNSVLNSSLFENYSFGKTYQDIFYPDTGWLAGKFEFGKAFNESLALYNRKYTPWKAFNTVFNSETFAKDYIFGNVYNLIVNLETFNIAYKFGETYKANMQNIGDLEAAKTFMATLKFLTGAAGYHKQIGRVFWSVNRSTAFGDVPWMRQSFAKPMFRFFTGFNIDGGVNKWLAKGREDFDYIHNRAEQTMAINTGVAEGLVSLPIHLVVNMVPSVAGGYKEAGLPGVIVNIFYSLGITASYPVRKALHNLNEVGTPASLRDATWFPVFRQDMSDSFQSDHLNWVRRYFSGEDVATLPAGHNPHTPSPISCGGEQQTASSRGHYRATTSRSMLGAFNAHGSVVKTADTEQTELGAKNTLFRVTPT